MELKNDDKKGREPSQDGKRAKVYPPGQLTDRGQQVDPTACSLGSHTFNLLREKVSCASCVGLSMDAGGRSPH